MTAAVTIDVSQGLSLGTVFGPAPSMTVTASHVMAAAIYPSADIKSSQALGLAAVSSANTIIDSGAFALVAATGRVTDPRVRVWTYTLDGHDFYVIRLGTDETLVFDLTTQQWSTFGTGTSPLWRVYNGTNWQGADTISSGYGSNVITGDDGNGSLYFLDPDGDEDDDALLGSEQPRVFERVAIGQIAAKGYNAQRCFGVTLLGSIGAQVSDAAGLQTVNLKYSDDSGATFYDAGDQTVPAEVYDTRLNWRSLGSIRYPGRLFKITDSGALRRIDSLEVEDGSGS